MHVRLLAVLALLLTPALAAPAGVAQEACPDDFSIMQDAEPRLLGQSVASFNPHVKGVATPAGCSVLAPTTRTVYVSYWLDEPGVEGLVAVVEGEGFEAFALPLAASTYTQLTDRHVRYVTPSFPLPDGRTGALRATLLHEDVPIRTTTLGPAL